MIKCKTCGKEMTHIYRLLFYTHMFVCEKCNSEIYMPTEEYELLLLENEYERRKEK